jgi:hypothetical protein
MPRITLCASRDERLAVTGVKRYAAKYQGNRVKEYVTNP